MQQKTVTDLQPKYEELSLELSKKGVEYVVGGWIDVLGRAKSNSCPYVIWRVLWLVPNATRAEG